MRRNEKLAAGSMFLSQFSSILEHKYSVLGGSVLLLLRVLEWGW